MTDLRLALEPTGIDSGWVPFEYIGDGIPIVGFPAIANQTEPVRLTLDTGNSSGLHASEALATRLGLDFSQPIAIPEADNFSVGSNHVPSAYASRLDSLTIGEWRQESIPVTISSYVDYLAQSLNASWEANVGQDVFGGLCVTVDYPGQRVRFSDSPPVQAPASAFRLGAHPWVIVQARVNGSSPRNFILDTGAGGTLVSEVLAAEVGLELGEEVQMQGATGVETARFSLGATLQVGQKQVKNLSLVVSDVVTPLSVGAGIPLSGIVGHDFFKDSIVVIDYKRKRIGFK